LVNQKGIMTNGYWQQRSSQLSVTAGSLGGATSHTRLHRMQSKRKVIWQPMNRLEQSVFIVVNPDKLKQLLHGDKNFTL
jgi:hypothetical protein